ncbi:MAG: hypothetical protein K2R93_10090 [Gemmatimonadaceae bacterium]|nr:hypothetical protein [Gemmatimonadaceae bacterium]
MSMIARGTRLCTIIVGACATMLGVSACSSDPVPTQNLAIGTTSLSATVATSPAAVPSVRIADKGGKGVKGVMVRWKASGGGLVTNDSIRTASDGTASSGGWRLGTTAGLQTLTATADGVPAVTFTATAAAGPVTQLAPSNSISGSPVVNSVVSPAPVVKAMDVYGNPVPGVTITFVPATGAGSVTGAQQTTNEAGLATVGGWQLGTTAGIQVLQATAAGTSGTTFSVAAIPGPAADLVRFTAAAVDGPAGTAINPAPGVKVVDAFGNGVGNVPVTFTPGSNSGSVTSSTVLSDPATGTAFVGSWILGTQSVQTLTATSSLLPGKSVGFTANVIATAFNLEVRFIGTPTTLVQTAFTDAARRWRQIIVGHVHDVLANVNLATFCDSWLPQINETVKDVVIYARTTPIDGAGQILGQAYVCGYNNSNNMPVIGVMEFDEADMPGLIARGTLNDVILHEMGHVLGFGTLWDAGRSLLTGAGTSDPYFVGSNARAEFAAMNTTTYSGNPVPIENSGGAGTRDSHWRETILQDELMTGYLTGSTRPLSRLTIASMRDMGYTVSYSTADAYRITAALYQFPFVQSGLELHGDIKRTPGVAFGPKGAVIKLR